MNRPAKPAQPRPRRAASKPKPVIPPYGTPEYFAYRKAQMARIPYFIDYGDPTEAVGHEYGVRKSSWLTRDYRRLHRKLAMDIGPHEVIDVLVKAGVKKWVLMGLHGYVGYLPDPRATQDVDILISQREKAKAVKAISEAWPTLIVEEFPEVVRFRDPNDLDFAGKPKQTIDLMLPWLNVYKTILKSYVVIDEKTRHSIPRVEAALVAKYSAMMSEVRQREKKEQDAVDFRRIVKASRDRIDLPSLRRLAEDVWTGAGDDIVRFLDIAVSDQPFPI